MASKDPFAGKRQVESRVERQKSEIQRILTSRSDSDILALPYGATEKQLRRQFRRLALILHPDKNKHPGAEQAFKALANAFQHLTSGTATEYSVPGSYGDDDDWEDYWPGEDILEAVERHHQLLSRNIMQVFIPYIGNGVHIDLAHNFVTTSILVNPIDCFRPVRLVIANSDMFAPFRDYRCTTFLISGPVGSGKSCLIRGFIYNKCQEPWKIRDKLHVFLEARDITTDGVWKAIERSLMGPRKQILYKHLERVDKIIKKIYVFIDGVEEVKDEAINKTIDNFVSEARRYTHPTVLVTTRVKLGEISKMNFDKFMETAGYSVEEGLAYVKKYCEKHKEKHEVEKFVEYLESKSVSSENMQAIVKDPMRLYILCSLVFMHTGEEGIEISNIEKMSLTSIYKKLDITICRRGFRLSQEEQLADDVHERINSFCKMLVVPGLTREISITDSLFTKFGLTLEFPLVQLIDRDIENYFAPVFEWFYDRPKKHFHHQWMARGVFCMTAPVQILVLFFMCSDAKFHNPNLLFFGCVSDDDAVLDKEAKISLLTDMVRWQLIMWPHKDKSPTDEPYKSLRKACFALAAKINDSLFSLSYFSNKGITDLANGKCSEALTKEAESLFEQIQQMFGEVDTTGDKTTWFKGTIVELDGSLDGVGKLVHDCLQELAEDIRATVANRTIGALTPCCSVNPRKEKCTYYHIPDTARWGHVVYPTGGDEVLISSWHPTDAVYLLERYQAAGALRVPKDKITLSHQEYTPVYGCAPLACWRQEEYKKALDLLPACRQLYMKLENTCPPHHTEAGHVLAALEAIDSYIQTTGQGKVKERVDLCDGHMYVTEMKQQKELLNSQHIHGGTRVCLCNCKIIVDQEPDEDSLRMIRGWVNGGILNISAWWLPDGREVSDAYRDK